MNECDALIPLRFYSNEVDLVNFSYQGIARLNPAAGGLSGTPTQSGTFSVTVTVKDSSSPALTASQSFAKDRGAQLRGLYQRLDLQPSILAEHHSGSEKTASRIFRDYRANERRIVGGSFFMDPDETLWNVTGGP
jgi:Putative Ig domain